MKHAPEPGSSQRVEHDVPSRIVIGALGLVVALGSLAIATVLVVVAISHRPVAVINGVMMGFAVALLAGTTYGGMLVRRAVRGWSLVSERSLRRDGQLRDPSSLKGFLLVTAAAAVLFVLSGGRPWGAGNELVGIVAWYFMASALWLLPMVTIHELGHVAGARIAGLSVSNVRIGPIELRRVNGRLTLEFPADGLGGALGFARLDLAQVSPAPMRFFMMVAGGPLASLMACIACVVAARALGASSPGAAHGAGALLWAGAFLNGSSVLMNLPARTLPSGQMTDGALMQVALDLRRSRARSLLSLMKWECETRRPRDWRVNLDDVLAAAADARESAQTRGELYLFAACVALDRNETEAVERVYDAIPLELHAPGPIWMELQLQRAMHRALVQAAPAEARQCFESARNHAVRPEYVRLAEATVLLAEGRRSEAADALDVWELDVDASGRRAQIEAGNLWALEMLRAALGLPFSEDAAPRPLTARASAQDAAEGSGP